ncbi:MAG: Abi family protein [Gammaproteobacteria bacterium]|nr:Abi family protein [Gammaproteobacteria bacterium]
MSDSQKRKYTKLPLSVEDQVSFLKQQGLIINNLAYASQILEAVSFYRLSGYTLPFKEPHTLGPRKFKTSVTFELIWHIYQFDKELRLLVSDAIEAIEIAFRTSLVNKMSILYGGHWYLEKHHFKNPKQHSLFIKAVDQIIRDKSEVFIKHYYEHYSNPFYPPVWMLAECLSFGTCSKLFRNLKSVADKKSISEIFQQHPTVIDSWMASLTYTRNLCAHHSRLWNRWFVISPLLPKNDPVASRIGVKDFSFYRVAYILDKLITSFSVNSSWKKRLNKLFDNYPDVPFHMMGFSKEWGKDSFWDL